MIDSLYHWIKAFHIISVIAWMAGMLYLPRLYVYHSQVKIPSETSELFKIMERRLLRFIINPAMISSWLAGIWLVYYTNALDPVNGTWMHWKFTMLIGMQICHALLARHRRHFANDKNTKTTRYYRILNEVPTILLIAIVILVVVRPF